VLIDLMMPGMDGIEVCRELKADKATRHVRVLAMTGYPSEANQSAILGAGAEVCLAEPIDHDRLLSPLGAPARRASATG
jgi:CheY-like chemotaxis protein